MYALTPPRNISLLLKEIWIKPCFELMNKITFVSKGKRIYSTKVTKKQPVMMKLSSPEFQAVITKDVQFLFNLFKKKKYELRIAGGAVRDLLLGNIPVDVDFATTATPGQMKRMFEENSMRLINLKGESHGTITVRYNEQNYEITTLRIDKLTDGRHAVVEFTTDWCLDAYRRDLTINAMFLDIDGNVYDYFNGIEDLKRRRVAFVGNASQRIKEDYLRILRYFRFHGRISSSSDSFDEEALYAIKNNAEGLEKISGERIKAELFKILTGNNGIKLFKKILSLNLGVYIGLPVITSYDELNRISKLIDEYKFVMDPVTILSAVLEDESHVDVFISRIKSSAYERDLAYFIVEERNKEVKQPLGYYQNLTLLSGNKTLMKSAIKEYLMYAGEVHTLEEFLHWNEIPFPMRGGDIISQGVKRRELVNLIKKELLSMWIESNFTLSKEELKKCVSDIAAKVASSKPQNSKKSRKYRSSF